MEMQNEQNISSGLKKKITRGKIIRNLDNTIKEMPVKCYRTEKGDTPFNCEKKGRLNIK